MNIKALEMDQKATNLEQDNYLSRGDNRVRSFKLYKELEEQEEDLKGITVLGYYYDVGIGTGIDKQKAFEHYQKADLGNDIAQYKIALMYERGDGIKEDINQAIFWYKKSAEQENKAAKFRLLKKFEGI